LSIRVTSHLLTAHARVRTARQALLTRENSPSSNSARASFPNCDEINYCSNYRNNTISFPLPSTRWQHTYHKGWQPYPIITTQADSVTTLPI